MRAFSLREPSKSNALTKIDADSWDFRHLQKRAVSGGLLEVS